MLARCLGENLAHSPRKPRWTFSASIGPKSDLFGGPGGSGALERSKNRPGALVERSLEYEALENRLERGPLT